MKETDKKTEVQEDQRDTRLDTKDIDDHVLLGILGVIKEIQADVALLKMKKGFSLRPREKTEFATLAQVRETGINTTKGVVTWASKEFANVNSKIETIENKLGVNK